MESPTKRRKFWKISHDVVLKQRKTIKYLDTKNRRLQQKVKTLSGLVDHLKSENKITSDASMILKVLIVI